MPSRKLSDLHPLLVEAYNYAVSEWEKKYPHLPQPFVTCTYRSREEQNDLFAIGRSVKGRKVTNARAGQSPHNFNPSFAFDIAFIGLNKKLDWAGELFFNFNLLLKDKYPQVLWGGDFKSFKDRPHFELKKWAEMI